VITDGQVKYHEGLADLMVPIDDVKQHPENYNNGDVEMVAQSIMVNGMYRPLFVQKRTGYIIAGNHTWEGCAMLGASKVPVVYLDVNDDEAVRIMLADNRIASRAMPDHNAELSLLKRLMMNQPEIGLEGTGYSLESMLAIEELAKMPLETDEFGSWPTFTVQVHPRVMKEFRKLTREADTDQDRFNLLVRLAGGEEG
jgi:ParB-like chromosome segregation protein Spo0J